jgi:hypothetical protein
LSLLVKSNLKIDVKSQIDNYLRIHNKTLRLLNRKSRIKCLRPHIFIAIFVPISGQKKRYLPPKNHCFFLITHCKTIGEKA